MNKWTEIKVNLEEAQFCFDDKKSRTAPGTFVELGRSRYVE
jgi:hypothetical protein